MSEVQISVSDQQATQINLAAPNEAQIVAAIKGIQGPPGVGLPSGGTTGQVPVKASDDDYDIVWAAVSGGTGSGGTGTVTSVGLSVPTGLLIAGSPVTTSGNFVVTYASGYSLPTIAKQSEWDTAFAERNQWNGSSTGLNAASGRTSLGLGDSATRNVGTTSGTVAAGDDSRFLPSGGTSGQILAKNSNGNYDVVWISPSGSSGGTVSSIGLTMPIGFATSGSPVTASGDISVVFASGYSLPTIAKQSEWDTAFNERNQWDGGNSGLVAASGRASLELGDAATRNVGTASGTVAAGDDARLSDARTPLSHKLSHSIGGSDALSAGDIGAETAGTSASGIAVHEAALDPHPGYALESSLGGAALLNVGTTSGTVATGNDIRFLPSGGSSGQVLSKASTSDYDVVWISPSGTSGGTVSSVGLIVPTGFTVSDSPVTTSGSITLAFASGYSLPTIANQSNWDTAFNERNQWDGGDAGLNAASGRTSLGLGDSAVRNVGTASGTVAAGDDIRFVPSGGTTGQFLRKSSGTDYDAGWASLTDVFILACSDETTALTTGTDRVRFRMPYAGTLTAVRATVNTAPTGAALVVDINEAGVSLLSTKLSIDASETSSTTAATPAVISDSSLADDAEISVDIDQIGSTVAGAGLKVALYVTRS